MRNIVSQGNDVAAKNTRSRKRRRIVNRPWSAW